MKTPIFFLVAFLLSSFVCMAQNEGNDETESNVNPRDIPAESEATTALTVPAEVVELLKEENVNRIKQVELAEAWLVDGWQKDTTAAGHHNYKVLKHKQLTAAQTKELKSILFDSATFEVDGQYKRCRFIPRFFFRFKDEAGEYYEACFSGECELFKQYVEPSFIEDIDPAHNRIVALERDVFGEGGNENTNTTSNANVEAPTTENQSNSTEGTATNLNQRNAAEYVVQSGDGLLKIARDAGISIERLCELNGLEESSTIHVGQKLKLR